MSNLNEKANKIQLMKDAGFIFGNWVGNKWSNTHEYYEKAMYDALKHLDHYYNLLNNEETEEDWGFIRNFMEGYVERTVRNFNYFDYSKIAYQNNKEGFNNVVNDFKSDKQLRIQKERLKDEVKELV
jgi:hypothetical protein